MNSQDVDTLMQSYRIIRDVALHSSENRVITALNAAGTSLLVAMGKEDQVKRAEMTDMINAIFGHEGNFVFVPFL